MAYVYAHRISETGEIFYIGKGNNKRAWDFKHNRNQYWHNIYNKHNIKVDILADNLSEDEAFALEKRLIAELKKIGLAKANLHEGGLGGDTWKFMPEARKQEIRQRMSNSHKGKKHSLKTIQKIKKAQEGYKSHNRHGVVVLDLDTTKSYDFPSITSAALFLECKRDTVYKYLRTGKVFRGKYLIKEEDMASGLFTSNQKI